MTDIFSDRDHWKLAALQLLAALKQTLNHPLTHLSGDMEIVVRSAIAKAESQS